MPSLDPSLDSEPEPSRPLRLFQFFFKSKDRQDPPKAPRLEFISTPLDDDDFCPMDCTTEKLKHHLNQKNKDWVWMGTRENPKHLVTREQLFLDPQLSFNDICEDVCILPETLNCQSALVRMRQDNADMAILVDEVGHATGHVTLHDVLDAWLAPTPDVTREDLDLTNLAGTTPIKDVFHLLGRSLQDIQDLDVQTIGGWVLKHIGRMPARGETLQQDGLEIYVMDTSPRHIKRLKITPCSGPLNKEHSQ